MLALAHQPDHTPQEEVAELLETPPAVESEAPKGKVGGYRLNERQREFARQFVLTGGNSTKAAVLAGYASPATMGHKAIVNAAILHEIKRLSVVNIQALLPVAIRALVEIATNPDADTRARVQAATALLDRGGLKPKNDGPALQVNVQINGQDAQAAIAEVWKARETRLERQRRMDNLIENRLADGRIKQAPFRTSDIDPPMSDNSEADASESDEPEGEGDDDDLPDDGGGDRRGGSRPTHADLPPHADEKEAGKPGGRS